MHSDPRDGTGSDTFAALGARLLVKHHVFIPGKRIFGAGRYAKMLFARQAHLYGTHFRPSVFNVHPGLFYTLRTRIVSSSAGEHA